MTATADSRARRRPARPPRRSLALERLEDRAVPATIAWDGGLTGNGSNWLDPVNWVGNVLPGPNDDATLGSTGGNPTITLAANTSVRSVSSTRAIQVTSSTLTLGAASA